MKKKIDALAYSSEIAQALKKAAFVTTKRGDKVNTMAIGWGHIGCWMQTRSLRSMSR